MEVVFLFSPGLEVLCLFLSLQHFQLGFSHGFLSLPLQTQLFHLNKHKASIIRLLTCGVYQYCASFGRGKYASVLFFGVAIKTHVLHRHFLKNVSIQKLSHGSYLLQLSAVVLLNAFVPIFELLLSQMANAFFIQRLKNTHTKQRIADEKNTFSKSG